MIGFENLVAGYGRGDILRGVSARAKPGEFIALVGPNGGGKSTLIKCLCALISPASGTIKINGTNLQALPAKTRARKIAYLPQSREAAPGLSVSDILELGRAPHRGWLGRISEAGQTAIDEAARKTDITDILGRPFHALSGGQQARVLLARALAVEADILLADEPIAALDPLYQLSMMDALKQETTQGRIVITALHDLALAHHYADRVWVMDGGEIAADDNPEKALSESVVNAVFGVNPPQGGYGIMTRAAQT